jgi:hypothetical protein
VIWTSVRYASWPTTYESVCTIRSPVWPTSTVVTTVNGLADVPAPVTSVWSTVVNTVRGPSRPVAVRPWWTKSGAYSVPPSATKVPQSPGTVSSGKN